MNRKDYIEKQKKEKGRRLFGVFPAYYPREIFWAMNVLPVEIWDPPVKIGQAEGHLQSYICSVVKLGLELILQGKCDDLDGFFFPHTCDSIQNLASIVNDYIGLDKPCYFFYNPKAPYGASSRLYYQSQLQELIERLEKQLGPMKPSELRYYAEQGQRISELLKSLYHLKSQGELKATNSEFYQVMRQREYLHPEDFIPLLESFLEKARGGDPFKRSVVLSGVIPNPPEILTFLDHAEVRIGNDDLLNCGRRISVPLSHRDDPLENMTENFFSMPPCTTRNSYLKDRIAYITKIVEECGANGVIFLGVKFCEPELFDIPQLQAEMRKKGVATLFLETELNQGFGGQLETRLEAFIEMIS
ncbi:2-hydroxyacyl-CoA dehydratase subunit D [Thermodesulfobacteriota bacterium]